MTARLEELLAAATPWDYSASEQQGAIDAQRELRKLAPDAVRLLIDMGEEMRRDWAEKTCDDPDCPCNAGRVSKLLARLDRLGNTT